MSPTEDDITWVLLREDLPESEAEIIASLLEANNIPVREQREGLNAAYRFNIGPLAGVRLYVPLHKAAEAEVLLKALAEAPLLEPDGDEPSAEDPEEPGE
ncbi:MAG: hypothetical protein ACYC5Y_06085 [Symbiobacteriia bacterium]